MCALKKTADFGAALSFDGQAAVFDGRQSDSPCYNCLFSENDKAPETACALMGVFAPLTESSVVYRRPRRLKFWPSRKAVRLLDDYC